MERALIPASSPTTVFLSQQKQRHRSAHGQTTADIRMFLFLFLNFLFLLAEAGKSPSSADKSQRWQRHEQNDYSEEHDMTDLSSSSSIPPLYLSEDSEEERMLMALSLADDSSKDTIDFSRDKEDDEGIDKMTVVEKTDHGRKPNKELDIIKAATKARQHRIANDRRHHRHQQGAKKKSFASLNPNNDLLPADYRVLASGRASENVAAASNVQRKEHSSVPPPTSSPPVVSKKLPKQQPQQHPPPPPPSTITPWIRKFLAKNYKDVLLPVPVDYWQDTFNLAQLAGQVEKIAMTTSRQLHSDSDDGVQDTTRKTTEDTAKLSFPIYRQALQWILLSEQERKDTAIPDAIVQQAASVLYLLAHQRYVVSPRGLDTVRRRFLLRNKSSPLLATDAKAGATSASAQHQVDPIFGRCPRPGCNGAPLLPFGSSDHFSCDSTTCAGSRSKRYCWCCGETFYHWESKVDGCAWGSSFCHLFLLTCGDEVFPGWKQQRQLRQKQEQVDKPRIFGFPLHASAYQPPQG